MLRTALLTSVALVAPFMPWKVVKTKGDDGTETEVVATKDGNPIWLDTNNAESVMQGDTITRLNGEAAQNRKDKEAAINQLKLFEGLDPVKAKDAIALVDKIDKKQLLDAGKVDELTAQITGQFTEKLAASDKVNSELRGKLNKTKLDHAFATSEFIKDKLTLPPDVARSYFAQHIDFDDSDNMIIKGTDGNPVMSKLKLGEKADLNEALAIITDSNPNRDQLLKGANHQGGGNNGGGGNGNNTGVKTYRRSEIDAMSATNPGGVAAAMAEVSAGKAQVVD